MIRTENNALLPSRTVTGWRIYIDYRKLNKATRINIDYWIRCWIGWQGMSIIVSWTGIRAIIRSIYP